METRGRVATLILNRPAKKNALTPDLLDLLRTHLDDLGRNDEIRTVVIRGAGDKVFSSGFDVSFLPTTMDKEGLSRDHKNPLEVAVQSIQGYPYPVIAMINGYAFGAACELALSCDFRVAADDAKMGFPPVKLGLIYPAYGMVRIVRKIGIQPAKELFFTGRSIGPQRIRELRLVDFQVETKRLEAETYALATEISENAPLSLKGSKYIFGLVERNTEPTQAEIDKLEAMALQAFNSDDLKEGLTAFFEKRPPNFIGK